MRSRGWIQDSGSLDNLVRVIEIFDRTSAAHIELYQNLIDIKISEGDLKETLKSELQNTDGFQNNPQIRFKSLVGTRTKNDEVNSLIQALIPGQNRLGIVDWACDNFVRFAYTLNFISYIQENDSFTITIKGLELSCAEDKITKFEILKEELKKYTPVVRVLELLYDQYNTIPITPSLTKFELGRELGFKGEDGFTTYSQNVFVQALNSVQTAKEKGEIRRNWEGSSDKYARMICSWLSQKEINWIKKTKKMVSVQIGTEMFRENLQAYQITIDGISAFRTCRAYSRNLGTIKNVSFEMLATKGADREFLRLRRAYILEAIKRAKTVEQIQRFLKTKNLHNISLQTLRDDIENFRRIGLEISFNSDRYYLKDTLNLLEIPSYLERNIISPSSLEQTKQNLREELTILDHKYLDLLDFSISGTLGARQFEIRIVELLNEIIIAKHLSGGNRPEIIGYYPSLNPLDCLIIDSKAYSQGFNIPANERDKMIRYIEEYNAKNESLNSNKWWENFKSSNYPENEIKFSFVSSAFVGQYENQMNYIINRTNISGSLITAETLLKKVNHVLDTNNNYSINNFWLEIGCNKLLN